MPTTSRLAQFTWEGARAKTDEKLEQRKGEKELTVDFAEHLPHALYVVEIEEPRLWVFLVLLERDLEQEEGWEKETSSAKGIGRAGARAGRCRGTRARWP
jgi:hypothetical protein